MSRRDRIRRELADIAEQLAALPDDAYARRVELRSRQTELRNAIAELPEEGDADTLRAREERLEEAIDRAVGDRLGVASIGGGGEFSGGMVHPYEAMELNRRIDEASGLEELQRELAEVRRRLERLEDRS